MKSISSQSLFHQVCVRSDDVKQARGLVSSQSLFHQVCVRSGGTMITFSFKKGRNPFFIRSVFVPAVVTEVPLDLPVAIPFSSGLCSFNG